MRYEVNRRAAREPTNLTLPPGLYDIRKWARYDSRYVSGSEPVAASSNVSALWQNRYDLEDGDLTTVHCVYACAEDKNISGGLNIFG